jgi:hypothetical protein
MTTNTFRLSHPCACLWFYVTQDISDGGKSYFIIASLMFKGDNIEIGKRGYNVLCVIL